MREAKRILFAPKPWGLLLLLLAINLMLTVAQDYHSKGFYAAYQSVLTEFVAVQPEEGLAAIEAEMDQPYSVDEGNWNAWLRREALTELRGQLTHLVEYPAYLEKVQANVHRTQTLSVFNQNDSFSLRNIEKTGRDFPQSVALRLDNDFAVTSLFTDEISGYLLLVFSLYLTLQFLQERKRGLWSLVYGSPNGRGRLALQRSGILFLGVTLGTAVLLGGKLLFGAIFYGGFGDLTRNVQSMCVFSDFPWVMPIWTALLGYFLLKILGMWMVGLAVWVILQAVNHLPLAVTAVGVLLALEYTLFCVIPDSYGIVFLRYVNLFAMVDVPKVALHYLNINVIGRPVQGFLLSLGLVPPLIGLLFAANQLLAAKKKPISRQNTLLSLLAHLRMPFSRSVGHLRLFGMELYKLLWLQKGLLVLLAVILFSFTVMEAPQPDTKIYDTDLAGLSASMQGPITAQTIKEIDSKISKYSTWAPTESVARQLDILQRLREKCVASLAAKNDLWLINPAPFAALMGKNVDNYQRQNAVVLLLALSLLLSSIFAQEQQNRMTQLLRGVSRGRGSLLRKKMIIALLLTVLLWLIFELGELRHILDTYGMPALSAPLQSFDAFSFLPYQISLGVSVLLYLLLRLLGMLAASSVVLLCSRLCKNTNTAILLSCVVLVLPACLSYMGIAVFDSISLVKLFSPLEATMTKYVASCTIGIAAILSSSLFTPRFSISN